MSDIKFQVRVSLVGTDIKKSLIFVNNGTRIQYAANFLHRFGGRTKRR